MISSGESRIGLGGDNVHLAELGARRNDLLDAKLAQLGLELTELLGELVLVLGPQLAGLNLSRRLQRWWLARHQHLPPKKRGSRGGGFDAI